MPAFDETRLREGYDAVIVPELMRTGELDADLEAARTENEFMGNIMNSLMLGRRALSFILNFDHGMIVPFDGHLQYTDDKIHRLQLNNTQTLASVQRSRDYHNYMIVEFAKYPLSDRAVHSIRQMFEVESEEPDLH